MEDIDTKNSNGTGLVDITIIGGGPTGLYGLFYAGMRGLSARCIDSLPELGGQLMALYPEKDVFDVAGFPKVLAKDLANDLIEQGTQFKPEICLDERVEGLSRNGEGHLELTTNKGVRPTRTLVIAAGKGAFKARTLEVPGFDAFLGRGVWTHVKDPERFRDRRVLVVGGGDSAFDWSLGLHKICKSVTHIHRSARFRAHAHTVSLVEKADAEGALDLCTHHELAEIHGTDCITAATIFDNRSEENKTIEVDDVVILLGFVPNLGPIADWGLELEGNSILVNSRMMTNIPGVFAAGDIAEYEGKLELISTGFGEAAVAVNNAVHVIDPTAKVNPGHSTSSKAFRGK
ncbi:MAG: NAD(P)/FAD-dependent oxidoreductase [Gemmatimonadota bacterium]